MSAAIYAAVGISAEAWKRLTPEQKKKIKAQLDNGTKGLAKAWAKTWSKNAENVQKTVKAVSKKLPKAKKKRKGKR
ncbi:MAG: hypothetical protein ACQCN3_00755 [Candidatus Bathyarchaeia archaeon]|jgi:TRAP-type C4-dicarboxylate transport system substrate-binding protein